MFFMFFFGRRKEGRIGEVLKWKFQGPPKKDSCFVLNDEQMRNGWPFLRANEQNRGD